MPRTGPRPQCWKVQGELPHKQYLAFLQMRAQANFRKEVFELTFEDFQQLWRDKWDMKGRGADNFCLTRKDSSSPWCMDNVYCIPRREHSSNSGKQSGRLKKEKQ